MNQEIKTKWVAALRSGEYEQGIGKLRSNNSYCCLGVLCDLYHKETGIGEWVPDTGRDDSKRLMFLDHGEALPEEVIAWAGLPEEDAMIPIRVHPDKCPRTLSSYNDSGTTFVAVADLIDKHL